VNSEKRRAPDASARTARAPSLIRRAEAIDYKGPAIMIDDVSPHPSITVWGRDRQEATERGAEACRALGVAAESSVWTESPNGGWIGAIRVKFPP
jgi:hypothetical protein